MDAFLEGDSRRRADDGPLRAGGLVRGPRAARHRLAAVLAARLERREHRVAAVGRAEGGELEGHAREARGDQLLHERVGGRAAEDAAAPAAR